MIDCHFHLDESLVTIPGLLASMDAAGIQRIALMAKLVAPIGRMPKSTQYLAYIFRKLIHQKGGLLHARGLAIYEGLIRADGTVNTEGTYLPVETQPDNDLVMKAVTDRPDRFWGWIFVNPAGPVDAVSKIERCIKTPGMIGVKTHPFFHNYAMRSLADTAALCAEKGLALLVHLGTGEKGDFKLLPDKYPSLKIIFAHTGIPYSPQVCDYAQEKKNVWVDLSGPVFVDLKTARRAIRRAGIQKCLFGTDGPYGHYDGDRYDFGHMIDMTRGLGLSMEDTERVGRKNFEEIIEKH